MSATATPRDAPSSAELLRVVDPTPEGVPALVHTIARSELDVIVSGETGVGKQVLASTILERSGRPGPVTRINCAALDESLLERELFGIGHGGTVLLDEVGELPQPVQAKLLRTVEQREVRFIATTHRDLPGEVAASRFRRDLYFRLDGVTLVIPPLRERTSRIIPLALELLAEINRRTNADRQLAAGALQMLERHAWPGNVRELRAVVERACLLAGAGEIGVRHLSFARPSGEALDRERVLKVLEECAGNQTRAAKKLGVSRTTLVTKLRLYCIPRPRT